MKPVEELGISQWPWSVDDFDFFRDEDATLASAAPEMYECLREAVVEACKRCYSHEDGECRLDGDTCIVQKWRAALEKAGGAERACRH